MVIYIPPITRIFPLIRFLRDVEMRIQGGEKYQWDLWRKCNGQFHQCNRCSADQSSQNEFWRGNVDGSNACQDEPYLLGLGREFLPN